MTSCLINSSIVVTITVTFIQLSYSINIYCEEHGHIGSFYLAVGTNYIYYRLQCGSHPACLKSDSVLTFVFCAIEGFENIIELHLREELYFIFFLHLHFYLQSSLLRNKSDICEDDLLSTSIKQWLVLKRNK